MSDTTSPTFLNGSFLEVLGSDPNNSSSNSTAQTSNLFQPTDVSSNDYTGSIITTSDDYLFSSRHPTGDADIENRSDIIVFKMNDDGNTQTQVDKISQPTQYVKSSNHGSSMTWLASMDVDNDYLVVGCPNHKIDDNGTLKSRSGAIAIYKRDSGLDTWTLKQFIECPLKESNNYFGFTVAISNDYITVTKGDRFTTNVNKTTVTDHDGSVFVYKKDESENWNLLGRIKHPPADENISSNNNWNDMFGHSLQMHGEWLVITDPQERHIVKYNNSYSSSYSETEIKSGTIFLFKKDTTSNNHYSLKNKIFLKGTEHADAENVETWNSWTPGSSNYPNQDSLKEFANNISLYKNTIIVSHTWYQWSSNFYGAIYIYDFDNDTGKEDLLYMCGGNNNDKFLGNWVDINKNRAVASMYNQGITTYKKENGTWKKKTIISEIGPQWYNYTFSYQNPRSYYYYGSSSGNVYTGAKHRNLKLTDRAIFWATSQRDDDNKNNSGSLFRIPFTADKNHLQVTFNENLRQDFNIDKTDFNLQYDYVDTDIKDIKIESGLVKIEPKKYFNGNDIKQLKLTYTKNATSGTPLVVGDTLEILAEPVTGSYGFQDIWDITQIGSNYYGVSKNRDKIYKITYDGVSTIFSGPTSYNTEGYTTSTNPSSNTYYNPMGITTDGNVLYVCTYNQIRKVFLDGSSEVFAGSTGSSTGSTDSTGTSARFYNLEGITIDNAKEYLYVSDRDNNKIRRIRISDRNVTTFAGSGNRSNVDGIGAAARFHTPTSLVITPDDKYLYVGQISGEIRKIDLTTAEVTTLSHSFSFAYNKLRMGNVDPNNEFIYFTDTRKIYRMKVADETITLFANADSGLITGPLSGAKWGHVHIFIDNNLHIILSDIVNDKILKIPASGGSKNIMDYAGNAVESFTHNFDDIKPTHTTTEIVSGSGSGSWSENTSTGAGKKWEAMAMSADGKNMVAGSVWDGNIWVSNNSGVDWSEVTVGDGTNDWYGITCSSDGTTLAAVVYGGNIWTSSNSGLSWTENTSIGATQLWTDITSSADGTKMAATVANGKIWTSTNSGSTWTSIGDTRNWRGIASSADGTKLAAIALNSNIWISNDSGGTWSSYGPTKAWSDITSSSDGMKLAAVAGGDTIWKSSNSGATWSSVGPTKGWYRITSSSDGTKLAAAVYPGNIWTSNDSGANWSEVTTISATNWRSISMSSDGKRIVAGILDGNIWVFNSPSSKFVLSFSEIIKDNANIDKNDFSVIFEDVAHTISSVDISNGKVHIEPAVAELCDVEITYTKNATSSKNLTDRGDNTLDTFTYKSTKRAKIIDFSLKDTRANTKINIGFSEYIKNNENIDKNDFTVSVNGAALPATKQLGNSVELFIGDGNDTRNFGTSGSLIGCDEPGQVLVLDDFYYIRDLGYLYKVDKNGCCLSMVPYGGYYKTNGGFVYLNRFFYWPYDHQIKKISLDTGVNTLFAGNTSAGHTDGNGTNARFRNISDITTDKTNMYVIEHHCVRKISLNGDVTTLVGTDLQDGDVDGIGTAVRFSSTSYKTITYHNNYLYIGDYGNKKIKKLNLSNNEVTTIITSSMHPRDVEVIGSKLYVIYSDSDIYRYDLDGSNEEKFAGNGAGNQTGDLLTSQFDYPYRISHHNGDIFIGEKNGHCVKIIKGIGNNIEYAKTKNGTILLNMSEKISAEKHNISISYTKNSDTNKQLLGMNNFPVKSFTSKADTEKPTVKDIFVHYSSVNAGISISGQTYRETDNSFNIVNDGGGTVGARYLASAGNYIMLSGLGSTNGHVFIYYYDGTNWNQQKVLSPEGNNHAQTGYYLTEDYAFINRSSTTNKGKVVVYKRDGINWNEFQTIEADDIYSSWYGTNNNKFGLGILSYKDYLVITGTGGTFQYNSNGAYIFKMNSENTSYVHHSIVGHGYPLGFYYFGSSIHNNISTHLKCSMAMNDDYLCISAMQDKNGEKIAVSGVCFIYKKLDKEVGGWNYYKTIEPSIMVSGGNFGCSVQINNRFLMISQKKFSSSSNNGVINIYDIYQDFKYIQTINPNKNGFGTNFSLSKDNILVSGGNHSNDTFIYKYNGVEFVQVHEIKKQGYTVDPSLTTNNFGFTSQILNDVIIVTDYSSSGNNNSNIYSSQLVKSDNKLIEVCFTKKISDNSNVDKNDFTIKTDGVSNDIVSVSINSGKLLFTVTNDVVNESTIQLTYTKNNDTTKNIVSGTLIVDSFNTKSTPDSFTLQDKGFVISGSKQNTSLPNISLRKTDEVIDFSTSGTDRVYSTGNHQVFSNDSNELLFTTTGNVHVGNDSAAKYNGFGKYYNRSYQSFVIMWKKVNNVWTKMHRFTVWDHDPQGSTNFGDHMVYHKGYLLIGATSVDYKGAIYLLKYNPSTQLMERVASKRRYDLTPAPTSANNSFGGNIAMDDKYIYASGWDSSSDIFIFDYSLELIFVTPDFNSILNNNFGNYETINFYKESKCRTFFKNGNYYLLQVVTLHNYENDQNNQVNGTSVKAIVLLKKHETLDNWTLHQVLYDVNAFPSIGNFGYTNRVYNNPGYDIDTNADTIFVSYRYAKQLLNNVDDIETIGGVYVFKFNVTTGLWGDDNVYSNAHFNSYYPDNNSKVVKRWSERIAYPNDIIIDANLYKFENYSSYHTFFGTIKYDSNKERLLISQQYGTHDNTIEMRGSITVYKNINNKYEKTNTIMNPRSISERRMGYPLGTTESGDIYFTASEDVGIAYGSINKVFVVNFTKKIKLGRNFNKNTLTVKKNGTTVSISNVYVDDTKLFIVCNDSLEEIEKSYVLYTPTSIVDENILSDNLILDSFTYGNITSAVVSGMVLTNNKLELSFTKTILNNTNLLFQDFEVYISGIKKKVKTVEVSNSKLLIEIIETISDINLVKVNYLKNSEYNYNLIDNNGVPVETFEHIQNSSNTTFSTQTIESGNVQLEFSDNILDNTNIDTNDFQLFISGQANGVSSVSVSNGKVLVGLSAVTQNSNINDICVIYRKNSNKKKQLKNIYGIAVDNFITNTETATPELSLNTHYYSSYYSENTFGALYDEYDWNTINSQINSVGHNLYHGFSVKLDGNYMFISQYKYSSNSGRVAIYKYQNSSWSLLKYIVQPHSGYDYFGYSLSYQNDYLIVSSPREDTGDTDAGSVYIYKKDEGGADNWGHIKTLRNPGVGGTIDSYSYFGDSMDMDGDYLLVSAYGIHERRNGGDYNNAGAVFLFKKDEGGTDNWGLIKTIQSQIIVTYTNFYYGQDVSIKDDVFVISNRYASSSNQGTEIYLRNGNNWEFSETIYHSDRVYGGEGSSINYGYTVKTDGKYILIYARYGNISGGSGNSGIVFLYSRDINNKFVLVKGFGIPIKKSIYFGMSLDINDDVIAIGAHADEVTGPHKGGAVYIYSKDEGGKNNWGLTSIIRRGYQYSEGSSDNFGGYKKTISLNYGNSGMIIGAPYDDVTHSSGGNVYIVNQGLYVTEKNKIVLNTRSFIKDTTLDVNDFSVESYTGVKTITNADVVNGRVVLTLSSDLENINRVLISYTKNADTSKNIKNSADIAMASFSVGDISDVFMTTLFKNTGDTSIDITFTKDISSNTNISVRDFTLKINNVEHVIESASVNSSGKVKLQIYASSMLEISTIDDVYVKYTKSIFPERLLTDFNGNEVITCDSAPPTIVDITHPYNLVENIGRQVTGQNYRYESRAIVYNSLNSGTEYKGYNQDFNLGYSYIVHKEWIVAWVQYRYENFNNSSGAVLVFKYNVNETTYKFYQFIPYAAVFGPADMTARNSDYTSGTYTNNNRYFGRNENIALNERYMIIVESTQRKYWLYELSQNSWVNINSGTILDTFQYGLTMNEYNYVFFSSHGSNNTDIIKIYRIINNDLVFIKDIGSPDTEITNDKYFSYTTRIDGKTLVTSNYQFPLSGSNTSSGTIYIYDQDKKEFNVGWSLIKKITAPQSWIDIPLSSTSYEGQFAHMFDVKDDVLTVLAGENNSTHNANKSRIFIYYKNEGGLNNWGLVKEIQPVFNDIGNDIRYFGTNKSYWSVACCKKYITITYKYGTNNEGIQIYSRNEGGQNNWGLLKEVIPEHSHNEDSSLHEWGYFGRTGSQKFRDGTYFGIDNAIIVPQYYYEGQITGSTSWYNIGRLLMIDTDTKSYLTNKISINTTEIIKNSNSYDKNDFTVSDHVGVKTVTDIDISLNSIILTVDSAINDINRVLVTYTKDTTNVDNNIKDLNDNKMDSFTFGDITNPNYLSKQLGSPSVDFGVKISGDNTNKYAEEVLSNSNNTISNLKNNSNYSSSHYYAGEQQKLFSRGNLLFMYYTGSGPGYIYVYEYKNGKWNDVGNYKNRLVNFNSGSNRGKVQAYYYNSTSLMGLFGSSSYNTPEHDHHYMRYNVNRFLSKNGLLWLPGQRNSSNYERKTCAFVPVSKLDNQLYFPKTSSLNDGWFTGVPFAQGNPIGYNMGLRCTAFGDDWACRVQRYSNTNDATTHFWFSRLNTNTNRFDYVRKIEANTFFNGSSLQRGTFNARSQFNYRAYINNDYYVITEFNKGGSDYNVWKRDASNNWIFLLTSNTISEQYWGRNTQGILYNHFYIDCGEQDNIILHDLSNNKVSNLKPPSFQSSYSYVCLDVCDDFAVVVNPYLQGTPNGSRGALYIFLRRSDNYFGLGNGPTYTPNFTIYNQNSVSNSEYLGSVQIHKESKDILLKTYGEDRPLKIVKYKTLYNVILQMNEAILLRGTESTSNFTLEYELNELTINSIVENNTNIQLQTLTSITNINNVGIIYESNNDITKNIRDVAGNPLNEFGDINTNPVMVSFALDSTNNNVLNITHNRKILNATYDVNDYQVKEGNAVINVNSITVDNKVIKLTLSQNISNINVVEITYTRNVNSTENVKDLFNNVLKTQIIGNTNEPQFSSIVTHAGEISYGTTSTVRDHNILANTIEPPSIFSYASSYGESTGFGYDLVSMGDYIIAFSYRQSRSEGNNPSGSLFVYKWNGTTYEYKSRTDTTTNFYSNGAYSFLSAGDNYVALSNYNMDLCCVFKMETNDTLVEETTIQPSGFTGAIITDINSSHAVHAVPRTAYSNNYGNGGIYDATHPNYQQRSQLNGSNYYGYFFRTFLNDWPSSGYLGHGLITTGGHIGGPSTGRYTVNNPGGVTLKFKIHAGETYALKLQYTTTATTSNNYSYWTHTNVGTDWNEVTLPYGYRFTFSGDNEQRTRAAKLEVYVLPFIGFSSSEADRFGNSCAIGNDWLAVSDHYATSSYNNNGGLVFIFKKENGSWVEKQKLEAPINTFSGKWNMNGGSYKKTYFGHHVLIKNNMLFVNHDHAINKEINANTNRNYGCVYVYKLNLTTDVWEYNTIIASNSFTYTENDSLTPIVESTTKSSATSYVYGSTSSYQYRPIAFNGTYFVRALRVGDTPRYVDIFKFSNDDFTFIQRISRPQMASSTNNDYFGNIMHITNDYLLVIESSSNAPSTSDPGATSITLCHIYKNTNDVWSYESTFMRDTSNGSGTWGYDGVIHGNRILIGSVSSRRIEWDTISQKNSVDLIFNQSIPVNPNLSVSDFSMIYNAENNPISNISVVGGKIRLETTKSITDLSNVKLTYTKNANTAQNIKNSNGVSVDSFVYKGKTTKPIFDSLTVSTNQTISSGLYTSTITLTFSDLLLQNNNIDKNDFSVEYNGSTTTVHTASIVSGKVEITIKTDNNAVADSDFLLTYTKNTNTTKNIGDGMDNYVDTFNYIPGFAFRDTTISNSKISLNWTTPLNETVSIDKDDFSVTIDGNAEVITNAEISGKHVLLTPTNTVTDPTLVRVTYTKNSETSKNLKSLTDNEIVETFSTSPEPASLSSVTLGGTSNPNKIHINWSSLSTTNKSRFSKFNFRLRNHRGRFIRFANIETDAYGKITLTTNENLIGGNRYYLSYRRDFMKNNRIKDANNRVVDNFTNRPILTNTITQRNISIESAVINNSAPTKVILEMNSEVTVDNKQGMPFSITTRGSNNLSKSTTVTSYNILNNNNVNQIELNTNRTFINGDKVMVSYNVPLAQQSRIRGAYSGLPSNARTYNYTVTASNGAFNINGKQRNLLYLNRGSIYVFNLSHNSLSGHPFKLSLTSNGSHDNGIEYTEGVTVNGTQGQTGANLTYAVPVDAPSNLYYYCANHSNMGSRIFISGSIVNTMSNIYNYDVTNKIGPAVFSNFTKLAANIGTNYGFTENVHSINTGEELGHSVDMDGDYSIIGGPGNNRVLINYFSNNAWAQQKELTGQGSSDKFGTSVAISGDTAVVGASNYSSNKGKIYIYKRSGTSWNSEQTIEGEATDDYFGHSVAIDNDTIVVGANEKGSNDNGKIYIYKRSGTTWNLESSINGETNNDKIGEKVTIKGDVLAYSSIGYKGNRGLVNIYTRAGSTWSKTEEIIGTESNEKIGESLKLDTNILLIGTPEKNKVMMYEYANNEWTRTEEIEKTDSSKFGSSVDIDAGNNNLIIGAISDTENGKIFVYQKENNTWSKTQDFIGEANGDKYGKSVATSNNRILTSAPSKLKTGGGASAGKFYYHKLLTTERLEVTFDDHLKSNPNISKDDFTMESDGNTNTIDKVYISNGKLIINHQTAITDTNTVVLTYTKNTDATKNLLDLDGSAIVSFTYPEGPSVEQAGIGTIQLRTKVTTVVPNNITKTNGVFDFTSLTIDKGVKTAVDDTPAKKRLRTRTFIKDIFKELKKNDATYNSKQGATKINKNMLAFTEKVSKRVHDVVRLYDADSTIDMRSVKKGESVYIPLETNESVVISLPNISSGGTTDYTFTKNADETTSISPALDGKVSAQDDDVLLHGDYNVAIGSVVVGDNPLHLHIPFIFDVSGNIVVYGEEVTDTQLYTARHEFTAGDPTSSLTAAKLRDLYFYSDEIEKYTVTVLAGKFALNGESEKVLRLQKGVRYIFDLSDSTNATHPLKFSETKNGTHSGGTEYVTGVRSYGTPGSTDSAVELFVSTNAPSELYYYCGAHSGTGNYGMGSSIKISDKAAMFYRGSDASSNIVKDALHADLCSETSNIQHDVNHSKVATKNGLYASPITSSSGNSLGNILVRYIATHLMGHPLAQAFITNDESIENDVNGTQQNQSKIAETLITQFNNNLEADATTPSKNPIIQSLFEQMIVGDINRFMVGDDSGKKSIPFQPGDKLVFYVNTKAKIAIDSNVISPATPITLTELFPNSVYPLLSDATGELDSGLWKITLTIS